MALLLCRSCCYSQVGYVYMDTLGKKQKTKLVLAAVFRSKTMHFRIAAASCIETPQVQHLVRTLRAAAQSCWPVSDNSVRLHDRARPGCVWISDYFCAELMRQAAALRFRVEEHPERPPSEQSLVEGCCKQWQ